MPRELVLKLLPATLLGSLIAAGIAIGVLLEPASHHWLLIALGAWLFGGGAGLLVAAPREQRRLALAGYAAGACVEAIGVAGLYWLMVMYPYDSLASIVYSTTSLEVAKRIVDGWDLALFAAALLCYLSLPTVWAFAGAYMFTDSDRALRLPTFRLAVALGVAVVGSVWGSLDVPRAVGLDLWLAWGAFKYWHGAYPIVRALAFILWFGLGLAAVLKFIENQRLARVCYAAGVLFHVILFLPELLWSFVLAPLWQLQPWIPRICVVSFLVLPHLAMLAMLAVLQFGSPAHLDALKVFVVSGPVTHIPARVKIRLGALVLASMALLWAAFSAPHEVFERYWGGNMFCRHAADCRQGGCYGKCYGIPGSCEIEFVTERLQGVHCECNYSWCDTVKDRERSFWSEPK